MLNYKVASRFTKLHLGLQLSYIEDGNEDISLDEMENNDDLCSNNIYSKYKDVMPDMADSNAWCEYLYYDIDNDSIDEMIVGYGTCDADFGYTVYTIEDGKVIKLGQYGGLFSYYSAEDGNGLYAVYGHMSTEYVYRVQKDGKSILCSELWNREIPEGEDYYINENYINSYDYNGSDFVIDSNEFMIEDENFIDEDEEYQSEYVLPDSNCRLISENELTGFDEYMCKLARNEIYARHGRIFADEELVSYFESTSWYSGELTADEFDDSVLNEYERKNLDTIVKYEKSEGFR